MDESPASMKNIICMAAPSEVMEQGHQLTTTTSTTTPVPTNAAANDSTSFAVAVPISEPPSPEWPECNPLYMEKRLVAKLIGDLDHCMIFRKGSGGGGIH